jgi:hypothetical protein
MGLKNDLFVSHQLHRHDGLVTRLKKELPGSSSDGSSGWDT